MQYRFFASLLIIFSLVTVRAAEAEGPNQASVGAFHELECVVDDGGTPGKAPVLEGMLPAGPGVDVGWAGAESYPNLFVMKKPGVLRPLGTAAGLGCTQFPPLLRSETSFVCFDGRFVWAPMAAQGREPTLYVIDPVEESVYRVGAPEGLPIIAPDKLPKSVFTQHLVAAPIAPGKAVVAVLTDVTTLAEVTFDPKSGVRARVVFEGRREDPGREVAGPEVLDFRFMPRPLVPLRSGEGPTAIQRLLVGRATNRGTVSPLIFDTGDWSVAPMDESAPLYRPLSSVIDSQPLVDGNSVYWLDMLPQSGGRLTLMRAVPPELKSQTLAEGFPLGHLVREGHRIHCLGMGWATWSPGDRRMKTISSSVPWKYQSQFGGSSEVAPSDPVLRGVWVSQHLGLLVTARSQDGRKVAFKLGDPPQIAAVESSSTPTAPPASQSAFSEPTPTVSAKDRSESGVAVKEESVAAAATEEFDWTIPEGSLASVMQLFRAHGADDDARPLALLDQIQQPAKFAKGDRLSTLAHEVARQALLIAAREGVGCLTRDAALGEALPAKADPPLARLAIITRFTEHGAPHFRLARIDDRGKARFIWQQSLPVVEDETRRIDYGRYVESAERWSREDFAELLSELGLAVEAKRTATGGSISESAEHSLAEMNFVSQFSALREVHRANRLDDESVDRLATLARGYANLGLLSECQWTGANRTLKARGLLYSQRLVASHPESPTGLWNRAYVKALLGFHQSALDDIATAAKVNDPAESPPDWLSLIETFCTSDEAAFQRAKSAAERPQLAALLESLLHARSDMSAVAIKRVLAAIKGVPDCMYLYDRLAAICDLKTGHVATELAPAMLVKMLHARLPEVADAPPSARRIAGLSASDDAMPTKVAKALIEAGRFTDREEISWSMLGAMTNEIVFNQTWRRADFMRNKWSVPVEDYLSGKRPVFEGHAFRAVLALYAGGRDIQKWLKDLAERGRPGGLNWERAAAIRRLLERMPRDQQSRGLDMVFLTDWYEDDVYDDLAGKKLYIGVDDSDRLEKRLEISPHHPDTIASRLVLEKESAREHGREWESRYASEPAVLGALAAAYDRLKMDADAERVLREAIKLSPDFSAYHQLTKRLHDRGEMEKWKVTWDEYLALPSQGLQHAHAQVEVANYLMNEKRYAEALPYASEAAESWAQWAMACAVRCYLGLGDETQEGVWRARLAERYPNLKHFGDYYLWACRTGQPEADAIWKSIGPRMEAAMEKRSPDERFILGGIYLLNEKPKQAFDIFNRAFNSLKEPDDKCIDGLLAAVVADGLQQNTSRKKALEAVAGISGEAQNDFAALAKALQQAFADNEQSPLDAGSAGALVAAAPEGKRPTVSYLVAYVLDKHGQTDAAVPFYEDAARQPTRDAMTCVLAAHRLHLLHKKEGN